MGQNNHSEHWGINPSSKTPPTSFLPIPPLKSTNCPSTPSLFRQSAPIYWFFKTLLPKGRIFHWIPKKSFSSLIPSYILKVTKFLGQVSQFEFLVMTKKNIFAYKLFLSLNISDFNLFLCQNCNPRLIKVTPSFPTTPSKSWGPVKHLLYENLVGGSTAPPPCREIIW